MKTVGGSDWATTQHRRFIPLSPLPALQTPAPTEWVASRPQSRFENFGEGKNNVLPLPELEPRIVQPVTSH